MKKIIFLVILSVVAFSMVMAQGRPQMNPQEVAKRQTELIKERVKLSEDQFKQVLEINIKSTEEIMKLMSSGQRDMELIFKIDQRKDSLIRSVLSPKQATMYDDYLKERRDSRRIPGQGQGQGQGIPGQGAPEHRSHR